MLNNSMNKSQPQLVHQYGELAYLDMLKRILSDGEYRKPEGEEGRKELFAQSLRFDLTENKLPLMTSKKTIFKSLALEMLWFISGEQDVRLLTQDDVKIWNLWANEDGIVGPLYGYQWRHWQVDPQVGALLGGATEIDQLAECIKSLRDRPEARSHMITAWRPDHLKAMSIKPCHVLLQFYRYGNEVSLMLTQRSCDAYLGVPFNIAQYALLTHMIAHQLGCTAKEFIWVGGDVHVYENHFDQVEQQLSQPVYPSPTISFNRKPDSIGEYKFSDFTLLGYQSAPFAPAKVSPQGRPGKGIQLRQAWNAPLDVKQ